MTQHITPRIAYLDNLKSLMIIFVVMIHAAVTYSGMGFWYYNEKTILSNLSMATFSFFQWFSQAYFMSFLFMIAAYFIPSSLERKGTKKFVIDRIIRLGIPTFFYIFLIHPICVKMSHPNINLIDFYLNGLKDLNFLGWTGPMWFVVALLFFSLFYVLIKKQFSLIFRGDFDFNIKKIISLMLMITFGAFVLRLFFPLGSSIYNFQLGYFSAYIFMFFLGIIAKRKDIFDKITVKQAICWLFISFIVVVPLWFIMLHFGVERSLDMKNIVFSGNGGMNLMSFLNVFSESFFCVAISIAYIGIFKKFFNIQNALQKFMSENSFGVYVFHAPILISISILFKNITLSPILKWLVISAIVIPLTFIFVRLIRFIPFFRKFFS